MKQVILLARVSTKRQESEGISLEHQVSVLKDYANTNQLHIQKEFIFQESAGSKIRKRFSEMINYIKNNPNISGIISYRVDRCTRNYRDAVLLDNLRVENEIELHFVHDRLVLKHDSYGRDIQDWDTKVFLAKQYLNRLQEDGAVTWLSKIKNGELLSSSTTDLSPSTKKKNKD